MDSEILALIRDLEEEELLCQTGISQLTNEELHFIAMSYGMATADTNMLFSRTRILRDLSHKLGLLQ
jgi:hypothetical protein